MAVGVVAFLLLGKGAKIKVPTPPGWEAADEETMQGFEEGSSTGAEDIAVDYLFTDGSLANFIAVAHGDVYIMDSPEGDDLATVEEFFLRHKDEITDELETAYRTVGASVSMHEYAVKELACGIPALFVGLKAGASGMTISQDFIFLFKDNTCYFAIVNRLGNQGNQEEVDFLAQNISFH